MRFLVSLHTGQAFRLRYTTMTGFVPLTPCETADQLISAQLSDITVSRLRLTMRVDFQSKQ